jgi:hypothetical protein
MMSNIRIDGAKSIINHLVLAMVENVGIITHYFFFSRNEHFPITDTSKICVAYLNSIITEKGTGTSSERKIDTSWRTQRNKTLV